MKRLRVRFREAAKVHYLGLADIPIDTVFKAVEFLDKQGKIVGVMIRGSNLVRAGIKLYAPPAKEYYFSLGIRAGAADVEVVDD